MEAIFMLTIVVISASFLAINLADGIFTFFTNLLGCLASLALTLLAIGTVIVAIAIIMRTPL